MLNINSIGTTPIEFSFSILRNRLRPHKMIKINEVSYIPSKYNHFLPLLLIARITYGKKVSPFYNFTLFITH